MEYPQTNFGEANIRMSLNPEHDSSQLDRVVECLEFSVRAGKEVYERELARSKASQTAKL